MKRFLQTVKPLTRIMAFFMALFITPFFITQACADIVDVWQFDSKENEIRAIALAKQLRCPQCQNQNLVESTSPIARDLRLEVYKLIDEGKKDEEIIELMVHRFGDFVLYNPKFNQHTLLLWLAPFFMLVLAGIFCWRYIKNRNQHAGFSIEQEKRVQRLMEQNNQDISS